jgi:hypothetical protein
VSILLGLFFEEWLKVELLKQEQNRLERKRLKKERKLAKKKRREEEALVRICTPDFCLIFSCHTILVNPNYLLLFYTLLYSFYG